MSQFPPTSTPSMSMKPHRGGMILTLGILGLVVCVICGIIAWVMGNADLKEMDSGRMDPSGRGLTQAGKICGMISVILLCVGLGIWLLMMLVLGGAVAAGAAAGSGG
ncbi:MAG: DUF4190 domain-containing protein [Phycisphaerales bacterium]